ncbi:MAG TPA: hypothetical protein VL175_12275 [Pirellulales bacterium]|nr:hypothetical protein [Pirellulales bacterium]
MSHRVFILSPARCSGKRADLIYNDQARFELATRIRHSEGVPLGEVFSFLSGLYFRGKLAYALRFGRPPRGVPRALVIAPGRGLVDADERVTISDLREMATVPVDLREPRYLDPLARDSRALARQLGPAAHVVLLGSIATGKYCDPLSSAFDERLRFPAEFAGRGDMSRGGLMLRCVDEMRELDYVCLGEGPRRGARPPKLPARRKADAF